MVRRIAAAVLGIVAAGLIVAAIKKLGHSVYPVPPDIDFRDPVQFGNYVEGLPIGAFIFVDGGWTSGTLGGDLLACFIARETPLVYAAIVGSLVLLGTIMNLLSIPHPLWFSITSVLAIIATIFITGRLGSSFIASPAAD